MFNLSKYKLFFTNNEYQSIIKLANHLSTCHQKEFPFYFILFKLANQLNIPIQTPIKSLNKLNNLNESWNYII